MKVLLYFELAKAISKSGIGRALKHQQKALSLVGVETTTDPNDDYDLLHINTVMLNSNRIINKARKKGVPVVYHAHSTKEDFQNSYIFSNQVAGLFKKWIVRLYKKGDVIITPTPYSKSLLEGYGIKNKIVAISNGIDLTRFKKDVEKEKIFKEKYNIPEGKKVIVAVGLWIKRKGILDFMEVAKRLPEYQFIWFGQSSLASIPREVRKAVTNPPSNVIMAGYVSGDVIEGAFSGSDAFFFPSYEETEGIVILEALASSQTIVVRDIPVYNPWLVDGVNCYLGKNNDDFVRLLHDVVENKLPPTGEKGLETAKERDLKIIGQKLLETYQEAIKINNERLKK
ncbi:TPA: glycosyltransferase family 4 protein [bacterium]|jgi:1,2-diacylglycerol-3-alpha-glucose alpha-1,2-glucosyltransferase|nr:glycosyltransferase family 4 protein [bacterium]